MRLTSSLRLFRSSLSSAMTSHSSPSRVLVCSRIQGLPKAIAEALKDNGDGDIQVETVGHKDIRQAETTERWEDEVLVADGDSIKHIVGQQQKLRFVQVTRSFN